MKKFLRIYFFTLLGLISFSFSASATMATNIVTSTGYAPITSSINKDIFRTRAIENALQKIVLESGQDLNSFSIVENGKILLDQIQTHSTVKVLQYDIIEEFIKNRKYHVTVQALLDQNKSTPENDICKKAGVKSINFSLKLKGNSNEFPAWATISKSWVLNEIESHSFSTELRNNSKRKSQKFNADSYTLFDKKEPSARIQNIYTVNTQISFERENKNNLVEKSIILLAKIETNLMRKDKVFSNSEFIQPYVIHQKFLNNSFLGATRGDWKKIKQHFSNLLKDRISRQLASLDCVNILPRVFSKAGIPFIDFGQLDGIRKSDMFVVKSSSTKKKRI